MARTTVTEAYARLKKLGMHPDEVGDILYVDADCNCCSSRYKVGELLIEDNTVDEAELAEMRRR